ncbi:putative acetyltransferase [Bradyrhizobium cosmicum]|uniref:Acetyltransferase n=2 Tax=Bradyrhizobium cosmicum TaxID=1404864 RepID=A0AAI8MEP2_9BRAD|nr:acyltransferase [Bradyrhizobium cosmicum]BAL78853.1 putative acetyltransferase [Bradyrhizobium cosmicum]
MPTFLAAFSTPPWIECAYFREGGFLVDLFFVLSGMVMSMSYVQSDFGRFSLRDFMVRRFARIYPLHIVMLIVLLLFRLLRISLVSVGLIAAIPAVFEVNNAYSFVLNVFLLHSLGFVDYLNWNAPSWSISVEFYTYLVFGLVVLCAQRLGSLRWLYVASALFVVVSWLLLVVWIGREEIGAQYDWGILRCFTSFFLGVLTVKAVSYVPRTFSRVAKGALQFAALLLALVNVCIIDYWNWLSFFAPFTFSIFLGSLLAFPDAAVIPRLLVVKPLVWVGKRSYSIYMVHAVVILFAEYGIRAFGHRPIAWLEQIYPGLPATLNLFVLIGVVLVVSDFTYRRVELPGGKLLRRWLQDSRSFAGAPATRST